MCVRSGPTSAAVGDTITYTITVEHDQSSDMSDVSGLSVVDDIAGIELAFDERRVMLQQRGVGEDRTGLLAAACGPVDDPKQQ